jgi:rhamnogalacturonan endolyase
MKKTYFLFALLLGIGMLSGNLYSQRYMENLNRGVVALNKGNGSVYISWRLLAIDASNVGFNLYRSTGGAPAVKVNNSVITATTDYLDNGVDLTQTNAYYVKPVINGTEQSASETYTLAANAPAIQYVPIALAGVSNGTYNVQHVYVGDIDGDGDYDYIVKRFLESTTDRGIIVDCYLNTGSLKWRMYMGVNIETGNSPMTSPILVYDFNNDGKAEILIKTGEGTTFGNGATIGDVNGDGRTDYNTHVYSDMYQVTLDNCPEFLSMVNGETGAEMARTNFLDRYPKAEWMSKWGDTYGNRMNFIMASVAYFDGVHPSAIFSRGPGEKMDVVAWDFKNGNFSQRWYWTSRDKSFAPGTSWVDFHQIKCVDVDNDGKDEISWGACMLDDNGSVLYTTKLVHGDRFQIGDFNPNRSGLEAYAIQQNNQTLLGAALYDARNGSILKEWYTSSVSDVGRGDVADVDPGTIGMELFSLASSSLQSCTGANISSTRPYPDLSVWWDGDPGREFFVGIGSGGYNPAINKWNPGTGSTDRLFTIYNDGGSYVVTVPYAGRAPFIGDILGDWREEIILETSDHSQLRIYTTNIKAETRIYTLMQNPTYRVDVTTKGYLCSKYPDFYLGWGMSTPPTPNITLVGGGSTPCTPTTIVPYVQVDGGSWSQSSTAAVDAGSSVKFGPQPTSGGTWNWNGPNGFTATTREVTISDMTSSKAGEYVTTYTNNSGCESYQTFIIAMNGSGTTITLTIQENTDGFCSVDGSVDNNNSGYTGAGFANTSNATGNGVTWSVNIPVSGTYTLAWRYANGGGADRSGQLMVNSTTVSNISMPITGSWTSWTTTSGTAINLSAGTNLIRLQATTSDGLSNIDYISITGNAPAAVSCTGQKSAQDISGKLIAENWFFPNPAHETLFINFPEDVETTPVVQIYTMTGKLMISREIKMPDPSIDVSAFEAGTYLIKMNYNGELITHIFIKK